MNDYLKKVFYFGLTYIIIDIIFTNINFFTNDGSIIKIGFDTISIMMIIGSFCFAFLFVLLIKLLSKWISRSIYDSNLMIVYISFCFSSFTGLYVLFLEFLEEINYLLGWIVTFGYFLLIILVLKKYWKYRQEIGIGLFLTRLMFAENGFIIDFFKYFGIAKASDFLQGIFILVVFALFLAITITLRRIGVYDFRSKKDKWLESIGEGPYEQRH